MEKVVASIRFLVQCNYYIILLTVNICGRSLLTISLRNTRTGPTEFTETETVKTKLLKDAESVEDGPPVKRLISKRQ